MIYQRHIPREELFAAQLEMLMQNGRLATVSMHLVGVLATVCCSGLMSSSPASCCGPLPS